MITKAIYYSVRFFIALMLFCHYESLGQCVARFDFLVNDLTVSFNNLSGPGATTFQWSFGDGSTSSLRNPDHTYQAAGEYFVKLIAGNPNGVCDSVTRRVCLRCVFPGDANNDGIVNNNDVLYVGLAYGAIGPRRANADSLAPSSNWVAPTGIANFNAGPNIHHADCDGDGIINNHDLRVIDRNYGFSVHKSEGNDCIDINDVPLYFEIIDSIQAGSSVDIAIMLGTAQLPAQNVYGISYSINYSSELVQPGTAELNYDNSLFGTANDIISLSKDSGQLGQIETAITRIDRNNLTIAGKIGTINFVMEENLAQKTMITEILNLSFSDITLIRSDETAIPVCGWQDSVVVYEKMLTGGDEDLQQEKLMLVYPNPTSDILHVELPAAEIYQVSIINILGKHVLDLDGAQGKFDIDVSKLVNGIYLMAIRNETTVKSFKVEISR